MTDRFTLQHLQDYVPLLDDPATREQAQLALLHAAHALLVTWSRQEYVRARQQLPSIDPEDVFAIMQEALLKAFDAVDLDKVGTSAVNYVYLRVIAKARPRILELAGGAAVSFTPNFLENARRAHAIISRLRDELGREPTDEEVFEGSKQAGVGGLQLGPKGRQQTERKPLTMAFIAEYRTKAHLLNPTEMPTGTAEPATMEAMDTVESNIVQEELRALYERTAQRAGIKPQVLELMFCIFGIAPYEYPRALTEAAAELDMDVTHARSQVRAWGRMCATPGGHFHRELELLGEQALADLGLLDIYLQMGDFAPSPSVAA